MIPNRRPVEPRLDAENDILWKNQFLEGPAGGNLECTRGFDGDWLLSAGMEGSGEAPRTATSERTASSFLSPMPLTFLRSSTVWKRVWARYAMIFSAVLGPMPGRDSSISCVAVFRSMGPGGVEAAGDSARG